MFVIVGAVGFGVGVGFGAAAGAGVGLFDWGASYFTSFFYSGAGWAGAALPAGLAAPASIS